jgi:hypothetical protein
LTTAAVLARTVPPRDSPTARVLAHAAVASAAIVLWLIALSQTDLARMRGLGLIDALPPTYFAAVVLAVSGAIAAFIGRSAMPRAFFVHLGALIVFLHGTTAVLYDEPRYPWVYKHLGVIDYIQMHGSVDRSIDIYNNWPGFFAGNALLSGATGLDPSVYAPWAQVFFTALTVAATLFAIRPLIDDRRQQMLVVLLVVLGDWIGQNYLAPQALAFPLMLVVLGFWLRLAPRDGGGRAVRALMAAGVRIRARTRRVPWRAEARPAASQTQRIGTGVALALAAAPALAVVFTHQLTPIVLIVSTVMLALVTGRRLGIAIAALVAAEVVWIALAWPYLNNRISLVELGGVPTAAPVTTAPSLPHADLTALSARMVVAVMGLLVIAGCLRRLRHGKEVAAPLALIAAPVLIVPLQSYGGEGGLRAYLFALPWLAVLASDALIGIDLWLRPAGERATTRARIAGAIGLGAAISVVSALTLVAYFGLELENYVGSEDVRASRWFEQTAPDGAVLAFLAPGFPERITGRYAELAVSASSFSPSLTEDPYTRARLLRRSTRMEAIRGLMNVLPQRDRYLAIGPSQTRPVELHGVLPRDVTAAIPRELRAARDFVVVYDRGGTVIFRYIPGRA